MTKLVTKFTIDPESGKLVHEATYQEVELTATALVGVWAAAMIARFMFDVLSALMFTRLEVWLRGEVFEKAMIYSHNNSKQSSSLDTDTNDEVDPAAKFGATYSSDIPNVLSLYSTLLRGVIMNVLLIITNFV